MSWTSITPREVLRMYSVCVPAAGCAHPVPHAVADTVMTFDGEAAVLAGAAPPDDAAPPEHAESRPPIATPAVRTPAVAPQSLADLEDVTAASPQAAGHN